MEPKIKSPEKSYGKIQGKSLEKNQSSSTTKIENMNFDLSSADASSIGKPFTFKSTSIPSTKKSSLSSIEKHSEIDITQFDIKKEPDFKWEKPTQEDFILKRINNNVYALIAFVFIIIVAILIFPFSTLVKKTKYPIPIDPFDLYLYEYAKNVSSLNQPLVPNQLPIDPDTPQNQRSFTASDGTDWKLVFSDEFNQDGRTFEPGKDSVWEAQDFHYWATKDFEYYSPKQALTRNGNLELILDHFVTKEGLNYTSGMVNSWNKFCFQGGYLEVRASLPGTGKETGYWPAVWTLGNLGRAGFGATTDGLWPYTYNTCDSGVLVNQTNKYLSRLPGQRLNACVCSGDHPSPGIGRGAPEIDIFEGFVQWGGLPHLSMSAQVAPFDYQYQTNTKFSRVQSLGIGDIGSTSRNSYIGGFLQQSVSAVHIIDPAISGGRKFQTYGFEYLPGPDGYVIWYVDRKEVFRVDAKTMGPNELSKIGQRVISEEPMYIIMNLGFSNSFGGIDFEKIIFPASLYVDYIRLYQHPDRIQLSCDPSNRPTAQYIMDHPRAYYNPNITSWNNTGYEVPEFDITKKCK
ncbi:hypothetical protein BB558_003774 [Smittium angustum]|uniref:GH16 domain-containing protein n=1 Tax=Smittium angustum TaxID=133377 RepID=A0A2U1J532_SMIAN|nr:hypothetical protein BB558_003774 [Smittium angustum]